MTQQTNTLTLESVNTQLRVKALKEIPLALANEIRDWLNSASVVELINAFNFVNESKTPISYESKDFNFYHTDSDIIKFYRRSNNAQSNYEFSTIKEIEGLENSLYFANDSSSFYDSAFLQFLHFCVINNHRTVTVLYYTRSAVETVTRSIEEAEKISLFITRNRHNFDSVKVGDLELLDSTQRQLFKLFVAESEKKFLHISNNSYFKNKHPQFLKKLEDNSYEFIPYNSGRNRRSSHDLEKEFNALMNYFKTSEELTKFINFLKANRNYNK